MKSDVDWELVARLNLYQFMLEVIVANHVATVPNGQQALATLRADIVDAMVNRYRSAQKLSPEDEAEWRLHAKTVAERFFDEVESRRQEIEGKRGLGQPGC